MLVEIIDSKEKFTYLLYITDKHVNTTDIGYKMFRNKQYRI